MLTPREYAERVGKVAARATGVGPVQRVRTLYEAVVPVILRHGGHANKFIGDGLLGVFGAPERLPDHADRAVAAALEIARTVRDRYGDSARLRRDVARWRTRPPVPLKASARRFGFSLRLALPQPVRARRASQR